MADFRTAHYNFCLCCNAQNAALSADFNSAHAKVAAAEGGYSNDARDKGNWTGGKVNSGTLIGTNYGISAPVLKAWLKREPTVSEMKSLPYGVALEIYKKNYWAPIKGDQIQNDRVAAIIYDASVNQGVGAAQHFVKDSLGTSTYDVNAINKANAEKLFNDIGKRREANYIAQGGYALNSWLARLKSLGYEGIDFAKKHVFAIVLGISLIATGIYTYRKYSKL